jgi:hypothetical protein
MLPLTRIIRGVSRPETWVRGLLRRFQLGSFELRLDFDAFARPAYAYGMYQAAVLAKRLDLKSVTAIEFGVAGGAGLLEMERLAFEIEKSQNVKFQIYGFDLGKGLPAHSDYRDLPYIWRKGFYEMDEDSLRKKLKSASLIIGDVANTVSSFLETGPSAPIGFISFDLDYYSSTGQALRIFDGQQSKFLPRVFCYFDDIIGDDKQLHCEYVGELLAIREFNENRECQRLCKINGLEVKRPFASRWADQMFVLHRFEHPMYGRYIGRQREREPLEFSRASQYLERC